MAGNFGTGVKLSKCPFCGGSVSLYKGGEDGWWWYYITTGRSGKTRCKCRVIMESQKYSGLASEKEKAAIKTLLVENWNRRYVKCVAVQENSST